MGLFLGVGGDEKCCQSTLKAAFKRRVYLITFVRACTMFFQRDVTTVRTALVTVATNSLSTSDILRFFSLNTYVSVAVTFVLVMLERAIATDLPSLCLSQT